MWTKKEIAQYIDLTSLNSFDSTSTIDQFLDHAIDYKNKGFHVAAVCLFPNFAPLAVQKLKETGIKVAVVAGNFPNAQGFLTTKLHECGLALDAGVDEVDIVINLGAFDAGEDALVKEEIKAYKGLMPNKTLKVILETGYLKTQERIQKASELAIEAGADFIKTSTGKEFPGATIEAAKIMAATIKKSGRKVGLKISGGIKTHSDALQYFTEIEKILGKECIVPNLVRIGASSLMKDLIQ